MQPAYDPRPLRQTPGRQPSQRPRARGQGAPLPSAPPQGQAARRRIGPPKPAPGQPGYRRSQPPGPARRTASFNQARRKKLQHKRRAAFLVMAGGLLLVLLLVFLLIRLFGKGEEAETPTVQPPAPAASVDAGQDGMAVSLPELDLPTLANGPYDEAEDPVLFNYDHAIPDDYTSALLDGGLVDIGAGQQMARQAAEAYLAMTAAAKADGVNLVPLSGYRSNERQTNNYNASIQRYLDQGFSPDDARSRTEGYYAIPGTSEHEAGLAIDIGDANVPGANIQDSFEDTEAFAWLQEHCTEYGFIMRYREEDFDITRIHYEPWHYRYVGANHAAVITQRGVTLEAYTEGL